MKIVSTVPMQGVVTALSFISNYLFAASNGTVQIFYSHKDGAPQILEQQKLTELGKVNSIKPGSYAGEFILAGSRCLIIGQMDLVSHKI